jgi:hypothetical protein
LVATLGPKRAERCPMGPFFEHLWDFSDGFFTEFSEVRGTGGYIAALRYAVCREVLRPAQRDRRGQHYGC